MTNEFNVVIEFAKFFEAFNAKELYITNSRKGTKTAGLKTYKKYVKDQVKADLLLFALINQKKHQKICIDLGIQKAGYFKGISPWLNSSQWDLELDDIEDLKRLSGNTEVKPYGDITLEQCSVTSCRNQVHGSKFKQCSEHITVTPKFKAHVKNSLKKRGLWKLKVESHDEWIGRLKTKSGNYKNVFSDNKNA